MPAKKMSNFPRKISTVLTELDQLRGTVTYRILMWGLKMMKIIIGALALAGLVIVIWIVSVISDNLQVLMIIATFLVVIVALLGEKFWEWYHQPDIYVKFVEESERCFGREAKVPKDNIQDEGCFCNVIRYYYRLKIENLGGPAKNAKVKIDVFDTNGKEIERFEPSTLRWISGREREDLAKGETDYINLCSQVKNHENSITKRLRLELHDLQSPRGISWDLPLRDYLFKVSIHGDNFNPILRKFHYKMPSSTNEAGKLH